MLEAVEVEQEHAAIAVHLERRGEDLLEALRHLEAVREPGERVEVREAGGMLGALALFGKIGARPTETAEVAELVEHRPAVDRPPAFFGFGAGTEGEIGECRARGEVE